MNIIMTRKGSLNALLLLHAYSQLTWYEHYYDT